MEFKVSDEKAIKLWEEFIEVPCHYDNNNEICIDDDWFIFFKGTSIKEINEWFNQTYSKGIKELIKFTKEEGEYEMNKLRRKQLDQAKQLLTEVYNIINSIMIEEENAFENLSEGFQATLRGEQMESNVEEMEEALEHINEALDNILNVE